MASVATSRRRGAASRITLTQILDRALEIVDQDGLDALSLRGLANSLGVTPMSLYRYVDGVDGLLDRVVGRLFARDAKEHPLPATWREAVIAYAVMLRRLLEEHPAYHAAVLRRPILSRPALVAVDGLIGTLRRAGLSPSAASDAYAALYAFCVGFAGLEQGRASTSAIEDGWEGEPGGSLRDRLGASGLRYLEEGAAYLGQRFDETRFHRALGVLCDGIAASLDQGVGVEPA